MADDEQEAIDLGTLAPVNAARKFMLPLGSERACSVCVYSVKEGNDLVCRRNPPQMTFMAVPQTVPGPKGPMQAIAAKGFAGFPVMRPDQWCGEFARK